MVSSVLGMKKLGAAHSDLLAFFRTLALISLSISNLIFFPSLQPALSQARLAQHTQEPCLHGQYSLAAQHLTIPLPNHLLNSLFAFLAPHVCHIYRPDGNKETIDTILKGSDRTIWNRSLSNEWGRLAQRNNTGVLTTNTMNSSHGVKFLLVETSRMQRLFLTIACLKPSCIASKSQWEGIVGFLVSFWGFVIGIDAHQCRWGMALLVLVVAA